MVLITLLTSHLALYGDPDPYEYAALIFCGYLLGVSSSVTAETEIKLSD
jgi:hypothetical protein